MGRPCPGPEALHRSAEGAAAAADYRALMGGAQVLYIGDLEPDRSAGLTLGEEDRRALAAAVKLGGREAVARVIRGQTARVREEGLTLPQSCMFFLEVLRALTQLAQDGGVELEEVFGPGFTGTVDITAFRSLDEVEEWLLERGLKLWERLSRQRSDSAWKTMDRAKRFIEERYADSGLSVETLCAHLHLSPAYFSTLFKRETQKSFTAYVTEVRMEHAAQKIGRAHV